MTALLCKPKLGVAAARQRKGSWRLAADSVRGQTPACSQCGLREIGVDLLLDLRERPDIQFLRAKWQGKGSPKPRFGIYVFAKRVGERTLAASA